MSGVPGAGGPIPKRSDQRRRTNAPARPVKKAAKGKGAERPPTNPKWHSIAKRWYMSLERSGQSAFYEPSDWSLAELLAEAMSRDLQATVDGVVQPISGASLASLMKGMTLLLVTEGDRRRLQIELGKPEPAADQQGATNVSNLDAWRSRTDGTG